MQLQGICRGLEKCKIALVFEQSKQEVRMNPPSALRWESIEDNVIALTKAAHFDPKRIGSALGMGPPGSVRSIQALPFSLHDTTAGVENELQAVVAGSRDTVDLPRFIQESNYYKNILRRGRTGDAPKSAATELAAYLEDNPEGIWENSWVRVPLRCLSPFARGVFSRDLLADKSCCDGPLRKDCSRFRIRENGEELLRIPVSYLLKLALADATGTPETPEMIRRAGEDFLCHFLSDNTSPETFSFFPSAASEDGRIGPRIAAETQKRFLLCQLLVQYANTAFDLTKRGQQAMVYFAPHPPVRQKVLNELISDGFYRELFMSPCLSGWDRGEEKQRYMALCHQVLSRSQLNAVAKLKEAGIITHNLVVLPNMSNISLANNGAHISIGSRRLTALLKDPGSGFSALDEKAIGDLVIKIVEHFLPLFVGTYSAAPYRIDFSGFHPEKVLGFLPHELDFTHLRMFWRRWKKKAHLNFLGRPLTPFGPERIDRRVSRLFRLRGDFVADFRLIDYPVALMSTEQSPALDGRPGNDLRLKKDLADLGVFDTAMSLYLLYRQRLQAVMGFSGFEGRYYSQFADLEADMACAADLQVLVTALAYRYALNGEFGHESIPDDPMVESERRQVFFGSAVGLPTFFVKRETKNRFLLKILRETQHTRPSRRYPGWIRVLNLEFRRALIRILCTDGAELIELLDLHPVIEDLKRRTEEPAAASAAGKLTRGILDAAGAADPMVLPGWEFNAAAETYYRKDLRRRQFSAALDRLEKDLAELDSWQMWRKGTYSRSLLHILSGRDARDYIRSVRMDLLDEKAPSMVVKTVIHLTLLSLCRDRRKQGVESRT
jgi:hypothetical protein